MKFLKLKHFADTHEIEIDPNKRYIGIIFTLMGWFLLGLNSVLNVEISRKSTIFVSFFFQFLGGFLFYLFLGAASSVNIGLKKTLQYVKPKELILVVARGVLGVVTFYLFAASKIWTSLIENAVLFSTEALFIPFILLWFLNKKIGLRIWIGIILGYIGVALTYFSSTSIFNVGGIIGLLGGLGMALIILLTSYIVKKDPPVRIAVYQMGIGVVASGVLALFFWSTPPIHAILLMIFSGVVYGIALFLFLDAFYYTESYIIGALSYSLIFFTEIVNWLLGGIDNKHLVFTGLLFILIGGLILIRSPTNAANRKD